MGMEGVWGDLICHFILSKILEMPYVIVTLFNTVEFNMNLLDETNILQLHIYVEYNGFNLYNSTHK